MNLEGTERYRLPNPSKEEPMLKQWIFIIGGDLLNMSMKDVYEKKRICKCHFAEAFFNPGGKGLLRTAVPTIDIPTMNFLNTIPNSTREFKSSFVHDICRTCLCQLSPSNSAAIFTSKEFHDGLSKILFIQVDQDDMLPKNLCLKCVNNLKVAISLKKSAEAANQVLKQKLRIAKSQNVQSVEEILDSFCDEIFSLSESRELANQIYKNNNKSSVLLMKSFNQNGRHDNTTILSKSDDQVNIQLDKLEEVMIKTTESLDVFSECSYSFQEVPITDNKQNEVDLNFVTRVNSKDDKQLDTQTNLVRNILNSPDITNNSSRKKSLGNRVKSSIGNGKIFYIPLRSLYLISELKRPINADLKNRKAETIVKEGLNKIFKCLICDKTYYNRNLIINHVKSHLTKYTCEYCGNSFNQKQTYTLHLAKIHKHTLKSSLCHICGKTVSDIYSHIKAHTTRKTIKCPVEGCDVFVKYNTTLASHIKQVHTKETVCICEQCGQQFSTTPALRFHSHKHSEVWRFECETCDVRFFYRSCFKRHLLTHCKQNSFDCPVCSAKFSAKTSIRKHCITYHPNHPLAANPPAYLKKGYICPKPLEKIYKCPHCRKVFGREYLLKMHIRNHHSFK